MEMTKLKILENLEISIPVKLKGIYDNFEPVTTSLIKEKISAGGVFIDVGANFGFFSVVAATLVSDTGVVVSIEASPEIYPLLLQNIEAFENVTSLNLALGDRVGITKFFMTDDYVNSGVTPSPFLGGFREVDVSITTLDAVLLVHPELVRAKSMIKVDVQGDEFNVLEGARGFIETCPDIKVIVEWAPTWMRNAGSNPEALPEYLTNLGLRNLTVIDDWLVKTMSIGQMIDEFRKDTTGKRFCNVLAEK